MLTCSLEKTMGSGIGSIMKILFVTENMPVPAIAGSSQRTSIILRALMEQYHVDVFLLRGLKESEFLISSGYSVVGNFDNSDQLPFGSELLKALFPLRDYSPKPSIAHRVKQVFDNGNYDLVIGRYVRPSLISGLASIGKSIIDVDDVDLSSIKNRINAPQTSWLLKSVLKYRLHVLNKHFSNLLSTYKGLFIASEQDRSLIDHKNMHVLPNISYNTPTQNVDIGPSVSETLLWVGSFNHRVNLDGLDTFISNDWLKLVKRCPTAILRVVGSHLPEGAAAKWRAVENVEVVGFVEDLEEEYREAAFSVVPLWDGAGTKIKVLESFMFKRTAVVTKHAARGFDLFEDGQALMIANSNEDFVNKAVELLENTERRQTMEQTAQVIVEQNYSFSSVKTAVKNAIESVDAASE